MSTDPPPIIATPFGEQPMCESPAWDRHRFHFRSGAMIEVTHRGDSIEVRGAGDAVGSLSIEPQGSNSLKIRVLH